MIASTSTSRAPSAQPARPDLSPVAFVALSPLCFRGERVEIGGTVRADLDEAVDLVGNYHAQLVNPADAKRIRDASHLSSSDLYKASNPRRGWVNQHTRS